MFAPRKSISSYLDVHMPKLTGLETLRLVKQFRAMLPCILLSAHWDEGMLEEARREQAFLTLSKPVTVRQITGAVRQRGDGPTPGTGKAGWVERSPTGILHQPLAKISPLE